MPPLLTTLLWLQLLSTLSTKFLKEWDVSNASFVQNTQVLLHDQKNIRNSDPEI